MSRIGKKIISIPSGVKVSSRENDVLVQGPLGKLSLKLRPEIKIDIENDQISFAPSTQSKMARSLWGLYRMLVFNMIQGVSSGFKKELELKGIGYKANIEGNKLILHLGFSHPIIFEIPPGVMLKVEGKIITVSGIDKSQVGTIAARIRSFRPPEPYKGKGIRYVGEKVRRKLGKRAATSSTTK